ncbi:MAG: ADP-ribosylglycohydrolase family protein [Dehalococcoidia bacterium]|nr:MAG: ADP-ribosylglycohydrolase family protein [Dehalococcoidia bacterium]
MIKPVLKSKFLGALVGTGVGDALGAPFEGRFMVKPEEVEAVAEKREVLTYTDDTHMMIGVAESLIRTRGFDGKDMTYTFIQNYELEPFRGYGPGPPHIFRAIRAGAAWDIAAQELYHGGSFGNGSAMRIAPIGVFYHDNPARLREVAYKSSQITHAHNLGKDGAALQAYAIALATNLEPQLAFDRGDFLAKLINYVPAAVFKGKLSKIKGLLARPDKARVAIELGNGIEAFNSVPTAIYSFLTHPDSFAQAVLNAVSLGGDADTIGAMTGAISSAYLGIESIPNRWQQKLENRLYLKELAEKLWELKTTA